MAEYEPDDSRNVTLNPNTAPGEPPRTGPREGETRVPKDAEKQDGAQEQDGAKPVRQHNNAQEVTGGGLPDPARAKAFDQDEA